MLLRWKIPSKIVSFLVKRWREQEEKMLKIKTRNRSYFLFISVNTGINFTFSLGVLSKDVFERHKLTGSEVSSPSIRLYANKFVSSVCTVIEDICRTFGAKTLPRNAKSPLPVNVPELVTSSFTASNIAASNSPASDFPASKFPIDLVIIL